MKDIFKENPEMLLVPLILAGGGFLAVMVAIAVRIGSCGVCQ